MPSGKQQYRIGEKEEVAETFPQTNVDGFHVETILLTMVYLIDSDLNLKNEKES